MEGQQKLFRTLLKGNHIGRCQGLALSNWFISFLSLLLPERNRRCPKASRTQVSSCIVEVGSRNICSCSHVIFSLHFPQSTQDSPEEWPRGSVLRARLLWRPRDSPQPWAGHPRRNLGELWIWLGMQREKYELILPPNMGSPCSPGIWEFRIARSLLGCALSPSNISLTLAAHGDLNPFR